jgi:hypothetical protein
MTAQQTPPVIKRGFDNAYDIIDKVIIYNFTQYMPYFIDLICVGLFYFFFNYYSSSYMK